MCRAIPSTQTCSRPESALGFSVRTDTLGCMDTQRSKRIRKPPQERRREVLNAAVELIGERGFNGMSVQDVADRVGISKQGVLRYVGSKDNMLAMVYHEYYNAVGSPEEFRASGLPGSGPGAMRFPAYLRFLVQCNAQRRMLVQLFSMLQVESFNPRHPLHEEFARRPEAIWRYYSGFAWEIPQWVGQWQDMRPLVRRAMEIMDGVQLRWLREPAIDLCEEWAAMEDVLFPLPLWEGYR